MNTQRTYGCADASYQAAGGEAGIYQLVDDFYAAMNTLPEAKNVRAMYPEDLELAKQKLATFLIGWLGGPQRYQERFGSINIPSFHTQWSIGSKEADAWLGCMFEALCKQPYENSFKQYVLEQLSVPAERIKLACLNSRHLRT